LSKLFASVLLLVFLVPVASVPQVQSYNIQNVKVPAMYETTIALAQDGRGAAQLLPPTHTDFIMRGWMKWGTGLNRYYPQLKSSVSQLKTIMPDVIYEGGISAQFVDPHDTWSSGLKISASDFNMMLAYDISGQPIPLAYGYMPDLASLVYRKYLTGWCQKQINAGVDAIFFDGVYGYAEYKINTMGQNPDVVNSQYTGYYKTVVDNLKSYAASRGRQFLAARSGGVLAAAVGIYQQYPVLLRADDFIHGSFNILDFSPPFVPVENFVKIKSQLTQAKGSSVPIIMYFDWVGADPNTQMSKFAALSTADQVTVLKNIDAATKAAGILFAYPVYGGDTSDGKYDSVKYGTYDTIVGIASPTSTTDTFGTTSAARTSIGGIAGYIVATKYTLSQAGTVTQVSVYCANSGHVKVAIYADNNGAPGTLRVANNAATTVTGGQWTTISVGSTSLAAGIYWIAFNEDANSLRVRKSGGTKQTAYMRYGFSNDMPTNWTPNGYLNYDCVCYATYTY